MNRLNTYIILFLLLNIVNCDQCKQCPPDIKLGDLAFQEGSLQAFPYTSGNTLKFESQSGSQILLTETYFIDEFSQRCYVPICSRPLISSSCEYVDQQHKEIIFRNDSITLVVTNRFIPIHAGEPYYDQRDTNVIETVNVTTNSVSRGSLGMVTSLRGKSVVDSALINWVNSEFVSTINLIDSTWTNVYYSDEIWYNYSRGVVGFQWNNDLWELRSKN